MNLFSFIVFSIAVLSVSFVKCNNSDELCGSTTLENITKLYTDLGLEILSNSGDINSYCSWDGVICAADSNPSTGERDVISLFLSSRLHPNTEDGRTIQIPMSITCLKSLETINISHNSMNNVFPSALFEMQNLVNIYANDSHIFGPIPTHLCRLKNLKILYLADNYLTGEIPDCIVSPPHLEILDLSDNMLSGYIPRKIVNAMSESLSINLNCNKELKEPNYYTGSPINDSANCLAYQEMLLATGDCTYDTPMRGCEGYIYSLDDIDPTNCPQISQRLEEKEEQAEEGEEEGHADECVVEEENACAEQVPERCLETDLATAASIVRPFCAGVQDGSEDELVAGGCIELDGDVPVALAINGTDPSGRSGLSFLQGLECLTGLESVYLAQPGYATTFPTALCDVPTLRRIRIDRTPLIGRIPDCVARLENLSELVLTDTSIEGPIPESLATIPALTRLEITCIENGGILPLSFYERQDLNVTITGEIQANDQASELDSPNPNIFLVKDDNSECTYIQGFSHLDPKAETVRGCRVYELRTRGNDEFVASPGTDRPAICAGRSREELLRSVYRALGQTLPADLEARGVCAWPGVRCAGHSLSLDLSGRGVWRLPAEAVCLAGMTSLSLDDNPIASLPAAVCGLPELAFLGLENTGIKTLPECLCGQNSQVVVDLCGVEVSAELEACLGDRIINKNVKSSCCNKRPKLVCLEPTA